MSVVLVTAAVTLIVAIWNVFWGTGGVDALRRRAIRQEMELSSILPEGLEKEALKARALDRAAVYNSHLYASTIEETWRFARLALAGIAIIVVMDILLTVLSYGFARSWWSPGSWRWWTGAVIAVGVGAYSGWILSKTFRALAQLRRGKRLRQWREIEDRITRGEPIE